MDIVIDTQINEHSNGSVICSQLTFIVQCIP